MSSVEIRAFVPGRKADLLSETSQKRMKSASPSKETRKQKLLKDLNELEKALSN